MPVWRMLTTKRRQEPTCSSFLPNSHREMSLVPLMHWTTPESIGTEHDAGANGVLDEGIGALLIDGIGGSVAGAVRRGNDGGFQCDQGIDHPSNAIMEERRPQMKTTDHRMYLLDAGDGLSVMHGIDNAGVTTARQHHQPLPSDVDHQPLIITDQRVRL